MAAAVAGDITVAADIAAAADTVVVTTVIVAGADGTGRDFIRASDSIPPTDMDTDTALDTESGPTIPFGTKGQRRFTQNRRS